MATISVRGLDEAVVARLKRHAEQAGESVNSVVVRLLNEQTGHAVTRRAPRPHDDLDALAGTWSAREQKAFERSTAPFAEVDPELWK